MPMTGSVVLDSVTDNLIALSAALFGVASGLASVGNLSMINGIYQC